MPIYEYRCEKGHTLEVLQRMTDDSLSACTTCGAPVQRVFHPVAVHFKGSGFYTTDYGKKGKDGKESESGSESKSSDSKSSESKSSESKSDSKSSDKKSKDSKSESKASASSSGAS